MKTSKNPKTKKSTENLGYEVLQGFEPPVPLPSELGFDELNLAELPIATLSEKTNQENQRTSKRRERKGKQLSPSTSSKQVSSSDGDTENFLSFEVYDWILDPQTKKRERRKWTVTGSPTDGLPIASDEEVVIALLQITQRKIPDFDSDTVYTTRYEICQEMGWSLNGDNYDRIEEAFSRLQAVRIKTDKFWDAQGERYIKAGFSIIDNFYLYPGESTNKSKRQDNRQLALDFSRFKWNEVLTSSFRRGGLKYLDVELWRSWEKPVTRRLHRHLDKARYWKKAWDVDLFDLASYLNIPLSQRQYPKDIKKYIARAEQEMLPKGYLADKVRYTKQGKKHKAHFVFPSQYAKAEEQTVEKKSKDSSQKDSSVKSKTSEAERVVAYFKEVFHRTKKAYLTKGEINLAQQWIDEHGYEVACHIVDFSKPAADATNWNPQNLAGIQQYVGQALESFESEQKKKKQQEQQRAAEQEEKEQATLQYNNGEELLAQLSPDERERLFSEEREELFTQNRVYRDMYRKDPDSTMINKTIKEAVTQRLLEEEETTPTES